MRVLFAALHVGYFRNLESVVAELARRGHEVHLAAERHESALGGRVIVERLAAQYANVTFDMMPRRERESFFLASKVRLSLDYLRYLQPAYAATPALRERARVRTPRGLLALLDRPFVRTDAGRRLAARVLDAVDHAIEPSLRIEEYFDTQRPDLVVITPLVGVVASSQLDVLRSAQARGIPTAVCVWSWDHLSSKAIIRDVPDRLFVWNDVQRHEATDMHGVPASRVVVTGAQCFDRWFDRQSTRDRAAFAQRVGLPDTRPFVLWVCSALFPGSPSEAAFVLDWAARLRASSDPALRDAAVLIRPHPSRASEWEGVDWASLPNVAFWGGNPIDDESRADYFDSLYHSAAVVGLNTSAFIEAGIVERPVLAILPEMFRASQEGTLHFHYLIDGGLLTTSRSIDEHLPQLAAMLRGDTAGTLARQRRFVEAFVRPRGLDVSATATMTDALEQLGRDRPPADIRQPSWAGRAGAWALEMMTRRPRTRAWLLNDHEFETSAVTHAVEYDARRQEMQQDRSVRLADVERARKARRKQKTDAREARRRQQAHRARA